MRIGGIERFLYLNVLRCAHSCPWIYPNRLLSVVVHPIRSICCWIPLCFPSSLQTTAVLSHIRLTSSWRTGIIWLSRCHFWVLYDRHSLNGGVVHMGSLVFVATASNTSARNENANQDSNTATDS